MRLRMERFSYSPTETEGRIFIPAQNTLATIERPWIGTDIGGKPFESCVPDGVYELIPHTRPDGRPSLAMWNPELGVYYTDDERDGRPGRYLCLLHVGNYVEDVVGCIAPGMLRGVENNRRMVKNSRTAMAMILAAEPDELEIVSALGAINP